MYVGGIEATKSNIHNYTKTEQLQWHCSSKKQMHYKGYLQECLYSTGVNVIKLAFANCQQA